MRKHWGFCVPLAALVTAIFVAGCSGGSPPPTPAQATDVVASLDVLEARAVRTQPNGKDYRVSLQVVKSSDKPFPTVPERTMILTCFSANGSAEEVRQELLSVAEWKWENSTKGIFPCGAPEVNQVVWQRQRKKCSVSGFGATPADDVCLLQTIRPIETMKWDFAPDSVLIFPLIGYDESRPDSRAPKGTAAVCLIGLTGQSSVVRLSEPVILTLDPLQPNVSVTATDSKISPERRKALDAAADTLARLLESNQFGEYQLSFASDAAFNNIQETTDKLNNLRDGPAGPLIDVPAFKSLQSMPQVLALSLVPSYAVAQRTEEFLTLLGKPERETAGLFDRQTRSDFGVSHESVPARWLRWGRLTLVVNKEKNTIESIRFEFGERTNSAVQVTK